MVRPRPVRLTAPAYAELAATSNFSFLRGASHPKDLVLTAILRGHSGLGLADRNVLRKLLVNAGLILLWYFFSLSISIVSTLRASGLYISSISTENANSSLPRHTV